MKEVGGRGEEKEPGPRELDTLWQQNPFRGPGEPRMNPSIPMFWWCWFPRKSETGTASEMCRRWTCNYFSTYLLGLVHS